MCKSCSSTQIMPKIVLFSGKIYTAGTNFTRPPVVTVATNLNSVVEGLDFVMLMKFSGQITRPQLMDIVTTVFPKYDLLKYIYIFHVFQVWSRRSHQQYFQSVRHRELWQSRASGASPGLLHVYEGFRCILKYFFMPIYFSCVWKVD